MRLCSDEKKILSENILRNGCGGTRAKYGTAIILRTVSALLEIIKNIVNGEIKESTLIDISLKKVERSRTKLYMDSCRCCGTMRGREFHD